MDTEGRCACPNLAHPGLVYLHLSDSSGAGVSSDVPLLIFLPLKTWDIVSDSSRGLFYASVAAADSNGPSVAVISPESGIVERYIPLPAEPGFLALSANSRYLYVAMKDRIRRIDLGGTGSDQDILASDLVSATHGFAGSPITSILPLPGDGTSFVATLGFSNLSAEKSHFGFECKCRGGGCRKHPAVASYLCAERLSGCDALKT